MRKVEPTVQTENFLFGQDLRAERASRELRPVEPGHSLVLGGGADSHPVDHHPVQIVKSPVLYSHPLTAPVAAPAKGSVDSHEDGHVVTQPAQGVTEQWVQPVPVGTEEGVGSSQVDLALLGKPDCSNVLRRGQEYVCRQTDTAPSIVILSKTNPSSYHVYCKVGDSGDWWGISGGDHHKYVNLFFLKWV